MLFISPKSKNDWIHNCIIQKTSKPSHLRSWIGTSSFSLETPEIIKSIVDLSFVNQLIICFNSINVIILLLVPKVLQKNIAKTQESYPPPHVITLILLKGYTITIYIRNSLHKLT